MRDGIHSCGRECGTSSIFHVDDCDECMIDFLAGVPDNGWTVGRLSQMATIMRETGCLPSKGAELPPASASDVERVSRLVSECEVKP